MIATELVTLDMECAKGISTTEEYTQVESQVFSISAKRAPQNKARKAKIAEDVELITGTLAVSF